MVIDLAHAKWRKRLLASTCPEAVYQVLACREYGQTYNFFFRFNDGTWRIKPNSLEDPIEFDDVDKAADFVISLGAEAYEQEWGSVFPE